MKQVIIEIDTTADGYCSYCDGELHSCSFLKDDGEEIYPQICINCGYGIEEFLGPHYSETEKAEITSQMKDLIHFLSDGVN